MYSPNSYPVYEQPAPKKGVPMWGIVLGVCSCVGCVFAVPILAVILFPVFSVARASAQQNACMSNVKQISLALAMYEQDYDERLPIAKNWMNEALPYIKSGSTYVCPTAKVNSPYSSQVNGYAFNSDLSMKKSAKFPRPELMQSIYDSTNLMYNASDPLTSIPQSGRHRGMNTIGYLDGHVKMSYPAGFRPHAAPGPRTF